MRPSKHQFLLFLPFLPSFLSFLPISSITAVSCWSKRERGETFFSTSQLDLLPRFYTRIRTGLFYLLLNHQELTEKTSWLGNIFRKSFLSSTCFPGLKIFLAVSPELLTTTYNYLRGFFSSLQNPPTVSSSFLSLWVGHCSAMEEEEEE